MQLHFFCCRDFTLIGDEDSRQTALALVTDPVSIQAKTYPRAVGVDSARLRFAEEILH